jgi:hypothetical protein
LPMPYGISSAHSCSLKSIHPSHQAFVRFDGSIEPMLTQEEVKERGNIGYRGKFGIQEFDEQPDERTSSWKWLESDAPHLHTCMKEVTSDEEEEMKFSDTFSGQRISTTSLSLSVRFEKKPFLHSPHLHFPWLPCLPKSLATQSREFKFSRSPSCRTCMNRNFLSALPLSLE